MRYGLNKLKTLLVAVVILFFGFIIAWFRFFNNIGNEPAPTIQTNQTQKITVELSVDYGDGNNISFGSVAVDPGETAYSLLVKKMQEKNAPVTTKTYDYGTMVESIDNVATDSKNYWSYSVNGQLGSVAADKHVLKNGDSVEWKYTPL